jgi:hypothetical protein
MVVAAVVAAEVAVVAVAAVVAEVSLEEPPPQPAASRPMARSKQATVSGITSRNGVSPWRWWASVYLIAYSFVALVGRIVALAACYQEPAKEK